MVFGLGGGRQSRGGTPESAITPASEVVQQAVECWRLQYAAATEAAQDSAGELAAPRGWRQMRCQAVPDALAGLGGAALAEHIWVGARAQPLTPPPPLPRCRHGGIRCRRSLRGPADQGGRGRQGAGRSRPSTMGSPAPTRCASPATAPCPCAQVASLEHIRAQFYALRLLVDHIDVDVKDVAVRLLLLLPLAGCAGCWLPAAWMPAAGPGRGVHACMLRQLACVRALPAAVICTGAPAHALDTHPKHPLPPPTLTPR
jgi:hypothetical protein